MMSNRLKATTQRCLPDPSVLAFPVLFRASQARKRFAEIHLAAHRRHGMIGVRLRR